MTKYLISFDEGAMTFPETELADVTEAVLAVVREALTAGVWVFGGGLRSRDEMSVVSIDGTITGGLHLNTKQFLGGFAVVDVSSRDEALQWAAKFAVTCRCAQDVREFLPEPTF